MQVQTDHEQIPFSLLLSLPFHLRVGCRGVTFGFSEKQGLLSGLQNYRVWSSGEISLSSQFSFTLPPPKLLFSSHLLINGVNDMRCQDLLPIFPAIKMSRTCVVIRRIWSHMQTSEQCLLLIFNKMLGLYVSSEKRNLRYLH